MPQAVLPRDRGFFEQLNHLYGRVRRLEVNKNLPRAGTAIYDEAYSLSAGATWTPDFTGATQTAGDEIGLILDSSGVDVPQGWIAWVTVVLSLSCTAPPAGEALEWALGLGDGVGVQRSDVMLNGAQTVAGTVCAASGWAASGPLPVRVGSVQSAFGSLFTPTHMTILATAIQLPVGGYPISGSD